MSRFLIYFTSIFALTSCDLVPKSASMVKEKDNYEFLMSGPPQFVKNYKQISCVAAIHSPVLNISTFSEMLFDVTRNQDHIVYADYEHLNFAWIISFSANTCNSSTYGNYKVSSTESVEKVNRIMPAQNADSDLVMNYIRNRFYDNQTAFVKVSTRPEVVSNLHEVFFFSSALYGFPALLSTIDHDAVVTIIDTAVESRAITITKNLLDVNIELCRLRGECQIVDGDVTIASERERSILLNELRQPDSDGTK